MDLLTTNYRPFLGSVKAILRVILAPGEHGVAIDVPCAYSVELKEFRINVVGMSEFKPTQSEQLLAVIVKVVVAPTLQ